MKTMEKFEQEKNQKSSEKIVNPAESEINLEFDERSVDQWYSLVINNLNPEEKTPKSLEESMLEHLRNEKPSMVSATMERACNLQCQHCLFQKEKSSNAISRQVNLPEIIENLVKQLPTKNDPPRFEQPSFLHDGRTLRDWHLDVFEKIRNIRPDVHLGLIDNGSYTHLIENFNNRRLKLDWLDISIDGTRESHNEQRDFEKQKAFDIAMNGLQHAREITIPKENGGRVSSPFTLTKINYQDIEAVADLLFSPNPEQSAFDSKSGKQLDYVDEINITTMNPQIGTNFDLEITKDQFQTAWEQIKRAEMKHSTEGSPKIFLTFYRNEDFQKFAEIVGYKKLWNILSDIENPDNTLNVDFGKITFIVDGVPIIYYPQSIWPQEGIIIDADGVNRVALSQKYTLEEYKAGKSKDGIPIDLYSVQQLDKESSFNKVYEHQVDKWWKNFGKQYLSDEIALFHRIHTEAEK